MFVYQGQVATLRYAIPRDKNEEGYALSVPSSDWTNIREGMFAAKPANGVVPYRVYYVKSKGNEQAKADEVAITFDARPTLPQSGDRVDPNDEIVKQYPELTFQYEGIPNGYVDCVLSIDLGNTRTAALLLDNVNGTVLGGTDLRIFQLPMRWAYKNQGRPPSGAFASLISLTWAEDNPERGTVAGDEGKQSFVKLGAFAEFNNRETKLTQHAHEGRYTMSSPKRYFWDEDLSIERWMGAVRSVKEGMAETGDYWLSGRLAEALAQARGGIDASRLPAADMLGAMLVEIYEQAVHYIGSTDFLGLAGGTLPRRIVRIHVTYPSTLLPRELAVYKERLQRGLQCYLGLFTQHPQVVLASEIDEASSVLAVYAYSEIRKVNGASMWLRTIGKKSQLGHQARIAVIDVGGGTTDLTIAQVESTREDAASNPFRATLDSLHRDGVNNAGDAFMFRFLDEYVKEQGLKAVATASGQGVEDIRKLYIMPEHAADARRLTQSFWFALALELAKKCDAIVQQYPQGKKPDSVLQDNVEFKDADDEWVKIWKRILPETAKPVGQICLPVDEKAVEAFCKSATEVFRHDAVVFAKAIAAYETDVLVFSGKTAEFAAVRNVFAERIALPTDAIIHMKNFKIGNWCQLSDSHGRIVDSKIATALGGALYSLRTYMPINLDFTDDSVGIGCDWGVVTGASVAFATPLFGEGILHQTVSLASGRLMLARRMKKSQSAILSYELRVKPDARLRHGNLEANAQVGLVQNLAEASLAVESVSGRFQDGVELTPEHVECRLCTVNGTFQMDKILEL